MCPVSPPHVPAEPRELAAMGSAMVWPWGRGDRHCLGTGQPWWLCQHHALGPWLPYFVFFAATGPTKLGYPRDVPLGMVGLALAPSVRTERAVPPGEGSQAGTVAPGGLWGHPPLPVLTHLQMLCETPCRLPAVIAQLQRGSSSTVCSKIANSLF